MDDTKKLEHEIQKEENVDGKGTEKDNSKENCKQRGIDADKEKAENAFRRKPKVARTPPSIRDRSQSTSDVRNIAVVPNRSRSLQNTHGQAEPEEDEEEDKAGSRGEVLEGEKRKREGETPPSPKAKKERKGMNRRKVGERLIEGIEAIKEVSQNIALFTKDRYTKKEIKEAARYLSELVEKITEDEVGKWIRERRDKEFMWEKNLEGSSRTDDIERQLIVKENENRRLKKEIEQIKKERHGQKAVDLGEEGNVQTKEIGVQVKNIEEEIRVEEITRCIDTGEQADIEEIMKEEWPEVTYRCTEFSESDIFGQKGDLAFCRLPKQFTSASGDPGKSFIDRYPDLEGEGDVETLEQIWKIKRNGEELINGKKIYKINFTGEESLGTEIEARRARLTMLKKWAEVARMEGSKHVSIALPGGLDINEFRKEVEVACVRMLEKVTIHITRDVLVNMTPRRQNNDEQVFILKAGNRKYSDLLKEVKEGVKDAGNNVEVNNVRKTRAGDLMIAIKGKGEDARKTKETIRKITKSEIVVSVGKRKKMVHILDLDLFATKEEVEEGIKTHLGISMWNEGVRVISLRPAFGETQNATVEAEESLAEMLIRGETLKIGWLRCRVRERIKVIRCFKCKEIGHIREECTGENREEECLRCGRKGHKVGSCSKEDYEEYCHNCKITGHNNTSMKCPAFKKLVTEARQRSKKSRLKGRY